MPFGHVGVFFSGFCSVANGEIWDLLELKGLFAGCCIVLKEGMEEPGQLKRTLIDLTAGAISGAVSRTITSPLDVIKIRFQVKILSIFVIGRVLHC